MTLDFDGMDIDDEVQEIIAETMAETRQRATNQLLYGEAVPDDELDMDDDTDDEKTDERVSDHLIDGNEYVPDDAEPEKATVGQLMGPDPVVASEIDHAIGHGKTEIETWETTKDHRAAQIAAAADPAVETTATGSYESMSVEVDDEIAETLIGVIYREQYEAERDGFDADTLILGVEQFAKLQAWCRAKHSKDIEFWIPFDEIVTVPGPMVHVARPNNAMLFDHYEGDD